ncbi:MAG: hypothetical protein AB7O57_20425 [Hyphomicrobiaceae bacterium]
MSKQLLNRDIRPLSASEIETTAGGVWAGPDGNGGCIPLPGPKLPRPPVIVVATR